MPSNPSTLKMMTRFPLTKIASARPAPFAAAFRSFSHTVSRPDNKNIKNPPVEASEFVKQVSTAFFQDSGLERCLLAPRISISPGDKPKIGHGVFNIQGEPGRVTFELIIDSRHRNRLQILHGGTIASIVDFGGSLAVASVGLYKTGVSTDLNVSYLGSGGGFGHVVKVEARCDKLGKTLAFTTVTFTNDKGEVFARGSHTKFIKVAHESQAGYGGPYILPDQYYRKKKKQAEENEVEEQSVEGPKGDEKSIPN